jgi:hypothetical protein
MGYDTPQAFLQGENEEQLQDAIIAAYNEWKPKRNLGQLGRSRA